MDINLTETCPVPLIITIEQKWYPTPTEMETEKNTATPTSSNKTSLGPTITPTPQVSALPIKSKLLPEVTSQMDDIQDQMISLRGLQFTNPVAHSSVTPAELRQHFIDNFFHDYTVEDAQAEALVLAVFGLLEPDFDLYVLYIELNSEQNAGFYDFLNKEMYVVQGEDFPGPQRFTYAH